MSGRAFATGLLLLGVSANACGGAGVPATGSGAGTPAAAPAAAAVVDVRDNSFGSEVVTISVGSTVEWRWTGASPHDVTGDAFSSPIQSSGVYVHTFPRAGVYAYRCTLHEHMLGEVLVR